MPHFETNNKNTETRSRKKMSPRNLCTLIGLCCILLAAAILFLRQSTRLTAFESSAIDVIGEYQPLVEDPDSLVLCGDIITVSINRDDAGVFTYHYFTVRGSFDASAPSTVCHVQGGAHGNYTTAFYDMEDLPAESEFVQDGELTDADLAEMKVYADIRLYLSAWELYGEAMTGELDEVLYAKSVDAKTVAKKLGISYLK